jgi:lysophospholipase L1-like esterase
MARARLLPLAIVLAFMRQISVRRLRGAVASFLLAGLLLGVSGAAPALATSTRAGRVSYYLALGDSVPVWNGTHSYPYLLLSHYERRLPGLRVHDIAISGETTTSMRDDGQYRQALRFLRTHRRHVALITIDIGGNDIVGCSPPAGLDPTGPCVIKARATIKRNLRVMLAGLRKAAPGVPVIGMNYYDPFLGDWLAGGPDRSFAISTVPALGALNRELAKLYGTKNTADVQGAFHATDLNTIVASPWGNIPIAVQRACAWLDIGCQPGGPETFGDDPNNPGAAVIASAFEHTIDTQCTRKSPTILQPCHSGA